MRKNNRHNKVSQVLWALSTAISKYLKNKKFPAWFQNFSLKKLQTGNDFIVSFEILPRETSAPIEGLYRIHISFLEEKVWVFFSRKNVLKKILKIKCEITGAAKAIIKVAKTLDEEIRDSRAGLKQLKDLFKKLSEVYPLFLTPG